MAEKSLFWFTDGFDGAIGDGSVPYTQDEFTFFTRSSLGEGVVTDTRLTTFEEPLLASGTSSPLSVTAGEYILDGFFYRSDAPISIVVPTPVVGTTGGRIILRADFTAATVRMVLKMNTDGVASLPALTDTPNVLREANIAGFTITTGGVINITVGRVFCRPGIVMPEPDVLEWDGINRLTIADEGVTAAMAGAGVPVLTDRQGGNATAWGIFGTTNYTVGNVKIVVGSGQTTMLAGNNSVSPVVTFPVAFSNSPIAFVQVVDWVNLSLVQHPILAAGMALSTTQLGFNLLTANGTNAAANSTIDYHWVAIGSA
jgi:hypothetical protein